MRDEMDGRLWVAHHDQFSQSVDNGLAGIGAGLRLGGSTAMKLPTQLFAILAASGMTLLTLAGTVA